MENYRTHVFILTHECIKNDCDINVSIKFNFTFRLSLCDFIEKINLMSDKLYKCSKISDITLEYNYNIEFSFILLIKLSSNLLNYDLDT